MVVPNETAESGDLSSAVCVAVKLRPQLENESRSNLTVAGGQQVRVGECRVRV
jgi:hypothetical protein